MENVLSAERLDSIFENTAERQENKQLMFSGIVGFYPKTPFVGAERSRFGLSMKEETVVLPLHHYLVLRRFFCPEPENRDPYQHAMATAFGPS